jgi:hypothetical protein
MAGVPGRAAVPLAGAVAGTITSLVVAVVAVGTIVLSFLQDMPSNIMGTKRERLGFIRYIFIKLVKNRVRNATFAPASYHLPMLYIFACLAIGRSGQPHFISSYLHYMKHLTIIIALLATFSTRAQKVFSVQYSSQADVKVFVVEYASQADLNVYKVKYSSQAGSNDGRWFFTEYASQAQKKVFFTDYASQADLKIYFVEYESQAGWNDTSRKHLLY